MDLASQAAARHEDEALATIGKLIGELHRDPAAEGVSDKGSSFEPERTEQVPQHVRVPAKRVVAARLRAVAVAEEIGSHDRVPLAQAPGHLFPGRGSPCNSMNEDEQGPTARAAKAHAVTMQLDLGLIHTPSSSSERESHPRRTNRRVAKRLGRGNRRSPEWPRTSGGRSPIPAIPETTNPCLSPIESRRALLAGS